MSNHITDNCISEIASLHARCGHLDVQLPHNVRGHRHATIFVILANIMTHFTNCLVWCRQNIVAFQTRINQHRILGTLCTLAGFLAYLQASNTCGRNADAVKKSSTGKFQGVVLCESTDKTCVSFSNTPARTETAMSATFSDFDKPQPMAWHGLQEISTHTACGGEYCFFIVLSWNHGTDNVTATNCYLCAPFSLIHAKKATYKLCKGVTKQDTLKHKKYSATDAHMPVRTKTSNPKKTDAAHVGKHAICIMSHDNAKQTTVVPSRREREKRDHDVY